MTDIGVKTGRAISDLVSKAAAGAIAASTPGVAAARSKAAVGLFEQFEKHAISLTAPLLDAIRTTPGVGGPVGQLLDGLAGPAKQFGGLAQNIFLWMVLQPVIGAVLEPFLTPLQQVLWTRNPSRVLSPADAALAVLKGHLSHDDAQREAEGTGTSNERFQTLVDITGEPLGLQELLFLFRRGKIDTDLLFKGIKQSRIRNEWIDAVQDLTYGPPPAEAAIRGAIENHLDNATAAKIFSESGIDPIHFSWMLATAGRPPGMEMMLRLMNRGLVSEDVVRQAIKESDIKNKYADAIIASRKYLPPVRSIAHLYQTGAVTAAEALQLYADDGVSPEDARAYMRAASASKTERHKDLAVSQISALYEDRVLSHADALTMIEAHGYDATEAQYIIELADLSRERKILDAAVSKIHNLYVAHKIEANEAGTALSRLGIAADQRTDLLHVWGLERAANVRVLTPAQIVRADRLGIISDADAQKELEQMGFEQRDAQVLLALSGLGPLAPTAGGAPR